MNNFPVKFRFTFTRELNDGTKENHVLKYAPDDWNDNVISWDRDRSTVGVLNKYTTSFKFIKEDAGYLRACFSESGVFSKVIFTVEEYDYNLFEYKLYYQGNIDFYSYEEDEFSVSVNTLNIGYKVAFDANFDTQYEIDIPDVPPIIKYDRLGLKNIINYDCKYSLINVTTFTRFWLDCDRNQNDTIYNNIESKSYVKGGVTYPDGWLCKINKNTTLQLIVNYDVKTSYKVDADKPQVYLRFLIARGEDNLYEDIDGNSWLSSPSFGKDNFSGEKSFNLNLLEGDLLYLQLGTQNYGNGNTINTLDVIVNLNLSYSYCGDTKYIPGIRPFELLKELVKKATNDRYNSIVSKQLNNSEVVYMVITSGDRIRGIKDGKIKTSLKDFFQSFKSMFGTGYTFEIINGVETLVVEHVNYFYNKSKLLAEVGDINNRSLKIDNNKIYNRLKIGYEDNTYDEINGKQEFNTKLEFSIDTDANTKELNLVSPYRADMYGIEFTIIDYEPKETIDGENDNDVFIIHRGRRIDGYGNVYELNRSYQVLNPDSAAGNTAFNVFLSPKRCLLRQIEYIKSLFAFSGNTLRFASAEKNYDLVSTGNIVEHADVDLSSYSALFKPVLHEFETRVPRGISGLINDNYEGYVAIRDGDKVIKGFIESIKENPGRNKSQTWKLLETSD